MQIIERIKKKEILSDRSEIQQICLDKLQSNPLPNAKSELWRLSNKSKLYNVLNYSIKNKESKFNLPFKNTSTNIIRLIIGKNSSINLKEDNYSIQKLKDEIEIASMDF